MLLIIKRIQFILFTCKLITVTGDVGVIEAFPHRYPHMLVIGYENNWTTSQRNAMALLFSFGHALALAKQLYGVIINSLIFTFAVRFFLMY